MRTTTLWCSVALGGLMIATAGTAAATDHGFYMGVDGGLANYPDRLRILGAASDLERNETHTSHFAWSFAAGYRFNHNLALEAGFADLGGVTSTLEHVSGTPVFGEVSLRARGKSLALLAHAPIGNWDPYFKVGAMSSVVNRRVDALGLGSGAVYSEESHKPRLLLGLGVRYAFSEQWAVSAALDYYARLGDNTFASRGNVTSPRFGFAYRF